ncbi:hypothetical protein [Levilactobacillus yonginensis]|uniref:hypothetical protein n=1 Tax=Levilactobacillus yonginensis TaxID=1054041 RepID=UPI00345CF593
MIARQLQGRGIQQPAKIDWSTLMTTQQATFAPYPANARAAFQTDYVKTLQGTASFILAPFGIPAVDLQTVDSLFFQITKSQRSGLHLMRGFL